MVPVTEFTSLNAVRADWKAAPSAGLSPAKGPPAPAAPPRTPGSDWALNTPVIITVSRTATAVRTTVAARLMPETDLLFKQIDICSPKFALKGAVRGQTRVTFPVRN